MSDNEDTLFVHALKEIRKYQKERNIKKQCVVNVATLNKIFVEFNLDDHTNGKLKAKTVCGIFFYIGERKETENVSVETKQDFEFKFEFENDQKQDVANMNPKVHSEMLVHCWFQLEVGELEPSWDVKCIINDPTVSYEYFPTIEKLKKFLESEPAMKHLLEENKLKPLIDYHTKLNALLPKFCNNALNDEKKIGEPYYWELRKHLMIKVKEYVHAHSKQKN